MTRGELHGPKSSSHRGKTAANNYKRRGSSWRRMYSLFSCWRTTLGSSTDMDFPEVLSPLSDEQSPHAPATKHCKSPKLCCLATRGPVSPFRYLAKTLKRQRLRWCNPGVWTNHTINYKRRRIRIASVSCWLLIDNDLSSIHLQFTYFLITNDRNREDKENSRTYKCYIAKTLKRQRLHWCNPGLLTNHTCTIKEDFQ